ncbi:MAG: hypothetical protein M3T56_04700 [Chloroflexota bacterium]|nr:hypothetical protein [Chloroflexota bacterium]
MVRRGLVQPLNVSDPKITGLDPSKEDDFRAALSRLCGTDVRPVCAAGKSPGCGACPNCVAAKQLPRLSPPWTRGKLNQALVLSGRPAMSEGFYDSFLPESATSTELLAGITQFRVYAMLRFGGFRSAYERLSRLSATEIKELLAEYDRDPAEGTDEFAGRTHGQDLIDEDEIKLGDRWYLGYISDRHLLRDFYVEEALRWRATGTRQPSSPGTERYRRDVKAAAKYRAEVKRFYDSAKNVEVKRWRAKLDAKRVELEAVAAARSQAVAVGNLNSAAYLAASHIDVYVATSMRESWEFEAMGRVVKEIFGSPSLQAFKLTKFDPTLSYYESRYDKGLVEGLMLYRAKATIYMVQETDTLGKDSELAATLAWGKPVIAYVPTHTVAELRSELSRSRLRRTFTRMLMLLAENRLSPNSEGAKTGLRLLRRYQPVFWLDKGEEDQFRRRHAKALKKVYDAVARAEIDSLNGRAGNLAETHPLGLQLRQASGVACGILLARTPARCAELLRQLFTNTLELRIDEREDATTLVECADPTSVATYRAVTRDPVLTNAFWTHYKTDGS